MAESNRVFITHLNNANYQVWKYKVELLLIKEGLWTCIQSESPENPNDAWLRKDEKARATIGLLVEDNQLAHIRKCTTSKQMWDSLKAYHQKSTLSNKVSLLKRLCNLKFEDGQDMEDHINITVNLIDQLTELGETLAEQLTVALLLSSLPDSYSTLITALETRPEADLTQELVKNKLIEEHKRRKEMKSGQQNQEKAYRTDYKAPQKPIPKRKCFFCKKPGHDKANCWKYKTWLENQVLKQSSNREDKHKVNKVCREYKKVKDDSHEDHICLKTGGPDNLCTWHIDSGATSHMTSDPEFFTQIDETIQETVYVADGRKIVTAGKGEGVLFYKDDQGKVMKITIKDVLFVPQLNGNLLSVQRMVEKGFNVHFNEKECSINKDDKVIAVATIKNSLYNLETYHQALSVKEKQNLCIHDWHRILGHRDIQAIKTLVAKELTTGFPVIECNHEDVCEICIQGKMTKIPFPKGSSKGCTEIMELIHSDLCGPVNITTPRGNRYILTLIDDYSNYTHIYLLKNKSEVPGRVVEFVKQMQNVFQKTPKHFRSDRGGEYMNETLNKFFKNEGIVRQTSAPYTPEQNGTAERKNRYLIEMTRCLLLNSGLDKKFWGEAVHHANYLQNRLPTSKHGMTPYQMFYKELPDIKNLQIFGTKAYAWVPDIQRCKLDDKATKLTFVGHEDGSKAYRLLNPMTNQITISRHVQFINELSEQEHIIAETSKLNFQGEQEMSDVDLTSNTDDETEVQQNLRNDQLGMLPLRMSDRTTKGKAPTRLIETVNIVADDISDPKSYGEAISSKDSHSWKIAMDEEIESLKHSGTWELTELPQHKKAIGHKWVFKRKIDKDGNVNRYKARLVAQGFSQKYGEDYDEVFAPVVRQTTFRTLLTLAGRMKMKVKHYDVQTAYLNGDIHHEVYMSQPIGYTKPGEEDLVCKLKKNIYGLKQGANEWNKKLNDSLISFGYAQSKADACLYSKLERRVWTYILVYVDDIIASSESTENLREFESQLSSIYQIKNLGDLKYYLGLHIERDDQDVFYMHQKNYIERKIKEFGLEDSKPSRIPLEPGYLKRNEVEDPLPTNELYRKAIGSLLYVSTNTRPDIAVSTSILATRVSEPTQSDWTEVKRMFRYLKTTINKKLKLGSLLDEGPNELKGYADANWAGDKERKSNSGYIFQLNGGTISWSSKRQKSVTLSTAEAEYVALAEAAQEIIWLERLIADFHFDICKPITIYEDNQSCIKMLTSGKYSQRTKHVDVKYHFVRDLVAEKFINVEYCPTEYMMADLLTKPLHAVKTAKFVKDIGLV